MDATGKTSVLFLCTHNSARSQMAEGLLRADFGDRYVVSSAGTEATRVHPLAVEAMSEIGIDITGHTSKILDRFVKERWDFVVTVCDAANERCPVFPGTGTRLHHAFRDPSAVGPPEDAQRAAFRSVRDEIRRWIVETFG